MEAAQESLIGRQLTQGAGGRKGEEQEGRKKGLKEQEWEG